MDDGSWLPWLIIVCLLLCAAYLAVCETAIASVSRVKLKTRMDRGDSRAKKAIYVTDNFERAISTILIGTNIVHIAAAALVTVQVTRIWGMSAVAVGSIITTVVVFFAGEMLPKSIAKKYSERFALSTAPTLCVLMRVLYPLTSLLTVFGNLAAKLSKNDNEVTVTEDELYDIIENMTDDGELDAQQGDLVHSALMFSDVTAENVLTARVDVVAVNITSPCSEILETIKNARHSRLPVYEGSIDNIIGVLQIRRYIKEYMKSGEGVEIASLLDEAYFIHQSAPIDDLLHEMSLRKLNMAIVTDSHGGTLGIVTVEDILEELVGEIWDEEDVVVETFVPLGGGRFEIDASMNVKEAFDRLGFKDPRDDIELERKSVGEWAYEQFEHVPEERDVFEYQNLRAEITDVRQNRIIKVVMKLLPEEAEEGGEAE